MTLHERMAQAFAALNDDGRRFWLGCMEQEVKAIQSKRAEQAPRPVLRLIQGAPPAAALPIKSRAPRSTKSKGA